MIWVFAGAQIILQLWWIASLAAGATVKRGVQIAQCGMIIALSVGLAVTR